MGLLVSGIILFVQHDVIEYLQIPSIAISVLIGSFFPIKYLLRDHTNTLKILLKNCIKHKIRYIQETPKMVLVQRFLEAILYPVALGILMALCFSPHQDVINQVCNGIVIGMAVFLVIFFFIYKPQKG